MLYSSSTWKKTTCDMFKSTTHRYNPLSLNLSGLKGRVSAVVVGVVAVVVSGRVIFPPSSLTQLTLGLFTSSTAVVTLHLRKKFWPATLEPVVVIDTTGSGRAGGIQYT